MIGDKRPLRTMLDICRRLVDCGDPERSVFFVPPNSPFHKKSFGDTWSPISVHEHIGFLSAAVAMFQSFDLKPGDRVAIYAETCYEWTLVDQALQAASLVSVPIYPRYKAASLGYILKHSQARVLVLSGDDRQLEQLDIFREWSGPLIHFIEDPSRQMEKGHAFKTLLHQYAGSDFPKDCVNEDDLMTIVYTSGTTGDPKGVMISHRNVVFQCEGLQKSYQPLCGKNDLFLSYLPLAHVYERFSLLSMLGINIPIVYAPSLAQLAETISKVSPTVFNAVPYILDTMKKRIEGNGKGFKGILVAWACRQVYNSYKGISQHFFRKLGAFIARHLVIPRIRHALGGRLRHILCGSAPLNPLTRDFFFSIGIPVFEGYGQTETTLAITVNLNDSHPGSVGLPLDEVSIMISDQGEICVKGDLCTSGYYKDDVASKSLFNADGWLKTGDIGYQDEDGYLYITDRLKQLIRTSIGKYVSPIKLESKLRDQPCIASAAVFGDGYATCVAFIFPNWAFLRSKFPEHKDDPAILIHAASRLWSQAIDNVNALLERHEYIRAYKVLEEVLDISSDILTPTLKLRHHILRDRYAKELKDLFHKSSL